MKKTLYYVISISTLLLTSCTLYEKPVVPKNTMPAQFKFSGTGKNSGVALEWWKTFHDPELNKLILLALRNNDNYIIAVKNIGIAKTYMTQSFSALFPTTALNYGFTANKTPSPYFTEAGSTQVNIQSLNASIAYQLNIWNQFGNQYKQTKASAANTIEQTQNTKIMLISSVVTTYFQTVTAHDMLINLQQQQSAAAKVVALYTAQLKSGLIDSSTLDDEKTQLENIQVNLAAAQKQLAICQNSLAYLLSQYPENFHMVWDKQMRNIPYQNFIPKNLSSKLVANRPDVQAAYYQVLATGYAEKASIAAFLPSFNITGNYGYAGTGLSNFLTTNSNAWNAALAVAEPIINLGQSLGAYRRAKLQYQSAIISYKDAAINAFTQIDNALITYQKDHQALRFYGGVLANNQDKTRVAKAQYHSGYTDESSFLNSRVTTLQSQNNVTNQQLTVIMDVATVYQNLGV